jgi:hypothetical protein
MNTAERTMCEIRRAICNPSRVGLCRCWWQSENPTDFRMIALKRINRASLAVKTGAIHEERQAANASARDRLRLER